MLVVRVIAGVLVEVATEPPNPFAETTDTLVTVPPPEELTCCSTNAVVAICVVLVFNAAVGAKGVPVKVGLVANTTFPAPVVELAEAAVNRP